MYEQSACEALVASVNSVNDDTVTRNLIAHHVRFRLVFCYLNYPGRPTQCTHVALVTVVN